MRILLVEDNSDHRELMRLALTGHDSTWEVEAVQSGEEALRLLLGGEVFDLVFLDYSLPGRDGLEVLEEIRRGEAPPPVVVVTGRGDEQVAVKAMKGGAYDYVVKGAGYLQRLPVVARRAVEAQQFAVERKRAEKALQESEERLRTIVEASLDAIIAVNVEGRLVLFNGAAQELFQYSEEEALNQPADILLREEIGKIHQERLEKFLKKGVGRCGHIGRRMEKPFCRKDGTLFEAEISMSAGRLNGLRLVVLAIHDITSRKKTEETLRGSELRYRELFDNISSGVAIYEVTNNGNDFIFKDFNRAGERLDGDRKEDIIGKSIYQVRPGINEYGLLEVFKRVWATGISEHYPAKFYQDERLKGWYDNFVYRLPSGEIVAVYDDITERKRAEEELRESEEKYRNILENIEDGYFEVDLAGNFTFFNPSLCGILGYPREEMPDMNNRVFMDAKNAKKVFRAFNEVYVTGVPQKGFEWETIRKDCARTYLEVSVSLIARPGEKPTGFRGIARDVTKRKRAEEELKAERQRLHDVLEAMPIMVCLLTPDYHVAFANRAFREKFGESHGRRCYEYCFGKKEPCDFCETYRVLKTAKPHNWQVTTTDGASVIDVYDFPFTDVDGSPMILEMDIDITERKQAEEELRTSRLQLRALYTRLQQIREEERIMIAREIHDEMGGGLTGLKMDLSWLLRKMGDADPGEERVALMDKIHTSNALIDQMIQVVRRISTDLRPSVLDDLGLIAALEWQLSEFTSRTEIPHEFATTFEYVNMEEDTAVAVFRIFQEALTNVVRHSRATKVAVFLREGERSLFGDESFVLEIRDNGKGITEEEILNPKSLGLLGMKERVLTFGGELSIRGEPGGGTALVLQIPRKQGEAS